MLVGVIGFGTQPQAAASPPRDCYPVVFVNGLGCWGEDDPIYELLPVWGMLAGSMRDAMRAEGFEVYEPSLGPFSSSWDRACELYASLVGTRVDYGAAHSAAHGHARYGPTYEEPLVPGWDGDTRKIHLIGMSSGGLTIRLFAQLAEEGCAQERAAASAGELSPLFTGAAKGRVASVTTLGTPNNGTSGLEPGSFLLTTGMLGGAYLLLAFLGLMIPPMESFYPTRLGQFDISSDDFKSAPLATLWDFMQYLLNGSDNALVDCTIDGAFALNETIKCQDGIYYFCYSASITEEDRNGNQVPSRDVFFALHPGAKAMGHNRSSYVTAGGHVIDDRWLPNDGLVNTISAQQPFGEPFQAYDPADLRPGLWNVMPVIESFDHADYMGGLEYAGGKPGTRERCLDMIAVLEALR